jgi:molybdopterin-binding protein
MGKSLKAINHGTIVSEVTLDISPETVVTVIVSKNSVENRGQKVAGKACALIKSTEVTLAIDSIAVNVID